MWQHKPYEKTDQYQDQENGNDHGKDESDLRFLDPMKDFVLEENNDQVDQICDDDTDNDR